jgi:hypothetical protein
MHGHAEGRTMTLAELERKVAALEAEVIELKARVTGEAAPARSWLDLVGKYADDPTFEEAVRLAGNTATR